MKPKVKKLRRKSHNNCKDAINTVYIDTDINIDVSDAEIESVEKLLLPTGCFFSDGARKVIRCWDSVDISACPGSGKTTVLLAKLKILAERMPFDNISGICVLSHTNVAVNEIKTRLSEYTDKLMQYPNYIGTIQTFIDRFVTLPYLKRIYGRSIQFADDRTYANHMMKHMLSDNKYGMLSGLVKNQYRNRKGDAKDEIDLLSKMYLTDEGDIRMVGQSRKMAGADKPSAKLFSVLTKEMISHEGLIRYKDAYGYAEKAVDELEDDYTDLFSNRFRYVFVDEYQDCKSYQRRALESLFDREKTKVMHIGDPDQAIYSGQDEGDDDWVPQDGYMTLAQSNRFGQEIADIISPLKNDRALIDSSKGSGYYQPTVIVYEPADIEKVLGKFIGVLESDELNDINGRYRVIGHIHRDDVKGTKLGDYWKGYEAPNALRSEFKYYGLIYEIAEELNKGSLYAVEKIVRKLMCRMFHYAGVTDTDTGKEFTVSSIRSTLKDEKYEGVYSSFILGLPSLVGEDVEKTVIVEKIDNSFREMIIELIGGKGREKRFFGLIPDHFMDTIDMDKRLVEKNKTLAERNVFVDPIRGRNIVFGSVHSVKGQTHDATLYVETETRGGSDISRILQFYGVGTKNNAAIVDYSRKVAYVGMSRPSKLLCVAMKKATYEKGKEVFMDWRIVEV